MQNAAAVAAAVRYHQQQPQQNVGAPINRYPHPYSQQSTSQQPNILPNGAVNSPQLLAASVSQQQQPYIKHHSKGRNAGNFFFYIKILYSA
jgi:hypothetical protein